MRRPDCCEQHPDQECPAEGCGQAFCSTWHLEQHLSAEGHAPEGYRWTFRL